jgi:hypothetical protein
LGGTDFRIYTVSLEDELADALFTAGESFWFDHVLPRIPPPADGSRSASDYLRRRFPTERGPVEPAPLDAMALVAELRDVKADQKRVEARRAFLETRLQSIIGDAAGITDDRWGKVTWTSQAGGISWKAVAEEMRTHLALACSGDWGDMDKASLDDLFTSLVARHRGADVRVLRESTKPWRAPKGSK